MDGTSPETCEECGFDSHAWRRRDAASLLSNLGYWWRLATDGLPAADLGQRPAPEVWSALEYGLHSALVLAVIRVGVEMILADDGCLLPDPPAAEDAGATAGQATALTLAPAFVAAELEREAKALGELAGAKASWANTGRQADGTVHQAEALLIHAVHDVSHHQMDIGRGLAAIGSGSPRATGSIARMNVSAGGVPKRSVDGAAIGWRGLDGDHQGNRKHHGRPFQAVCLWSSEVIEALAGGGHPIGAGSAGENLTLTGIDWASLRAGCRMRVGTTLLELSFPAVPCHHQKQWFADGDFSRIDHDLSPGAARWYAWVRQPGEARAGDEVIIQP